MFDSVECTMGRQNAEVKQMVDIIPETVNRIRLSDDELVLLDRVLKAVNLLVLKSNELEFYHILVARVHTRLHIKNTKENKKVK